MVKLCASVAGGGGSPQGLLHLLPGLGLHWYVHSTLTQVAYDVKLPGGEHLTGQGWAHVEKNWGSRCDGCSTTANYYYGCSTSTSG
jgi:hypothetical protein